MPSTATERKKAATQLLISPHTKAELQALAVVRQESVAEVSRGIIEAYLPVIGRKHEAQLRHLDLAFSVMRVEPAAALQAMIDQKIRYADLFDDRGVPKHVFPGKI